MFELKIHAGTDKSGAPEAFDTITLHSGTLLAVVGNTGAGKSRLVQDIEQLVWGESVSKRRIALEQNGCPVSKNQGLIAHLGQNMRFMLDTNVADFISLHNQCRGRDIPLQTVLDLANSITPEHITATMHLNVLSGGQTRALMIADIALICDSPIVLMDEIENAGIDKIKAFEALLGQDKLLVLVTHDPHTALMAQKRIVLHNGGIVKQIDRTPQEALLYNDMTKDYLLHPQRQQLLRTGAPIL